MRRPTAAAIALTALLLTAGLATLWLAPPAPDRQWTVIWELVVGAGFAAAGCTVTALVPRSVPGWLLVLGAVLLLAAPPTAAAGWPRAADLATVLAVAVVLPAGLLRIVPRHRAVTALRVLDAVTVLAGTVSVAAVAVDAGTVLAAASTVAGVAVFCSGWVQFEASDGDERRQVLWLVLGVAASVPTAALFLVAVDTQPVSTAFVAGVVAVLSLQLPLSAAVALVAPRWMDVRSVISHAVVLTVMLSLAVAVYAGGEAGFELLTGDPPGLGPRALLAAATAAGFHPARVQVRASMDELLFGGRTDPVDTIARLGTQLTAGSAPQDWLDTLRSALAVPGAVLREGDRVIAASGDLDPARATVTALRTGTEHVGDLVVGIPPDQLRLAPATQAVLALVAAPLAQALRAVRLAEQLQTSRGRVVAALEEERRRVRRDLHDGLGPTLTGIAYSADAALNLIRVDSAPDREQAAKVLRALRADAGEAIAEVRRIVYGMRPKALDELGLVEAVRQRVQHLRAADGEVLTVTVHAPAELPDLPAAVEVAAYRVAVEAVTNVARHAGVGTATVEFTVRPGPRLRISVEDEGRSPEQWRPGVGLTSMRERVEQIGGVLEVRSGPAGGSITAEVPLELPA